MLPGSWRVIPLVKMVLGLLTIAALPTTIGVAEGISSRNKEQDAVDNEELMRKFTLECFCDAQSRKRGEIHSGRIVLRDGKVRQHVARWNSSLGYTDPDKD